MSHQTTRRQASKRIRRVRENLTVCINQLLEVGVTYDTVKPSFSENVARMVSAFEALKSAMTDMIDEFDQFV